jgi:hypothetical protein
MMPFLRGDPARRPELQALSGSEHGEVTEIIASEID